MELRRLCQDPGCPLCGSNSRSASSTRDMTVDSRRALLSRLVRLSRGCALLPGCLSSRENGGSRSADSSVAVALLVVTAHPPEGTQASTLVRRFTGVSCRSAKSRIIENLLASEALALRSMPAVPAAIPTPPQLRSTRGRQSEALAPYRLPIRRSGCQALPGSASMGRSVGVWDPAALRAGARAYFGPRPSGWLRGRRQDVDGGSAGRNRHGAWHPRSHERPRPCIAEPARSSQGVGRRFDLPPKQIGAVTPSGLGVPCQAPRSELLVLRSVSPVCRGLACVQR